MSSMFIVVCSFEPPRCDRIRFTPARRSSNPSKPRSNARRFVCRVNDHTVAVALAPRRSGRHVLSTSATRVFSFQRREPTSCVASAGSCEHLFAKAFTAHRDDSSLLRRTNRFRGPAPNHWFWRCRQGRGLFGLAPSMHSDRLSNRHQLDSKKSSSFGLQRASRVSLVEEFRLPARPQDAIGSLDSSSTSTVVERSPTRFQVGDGFPGTVQPLWLGPFSMRLSATRF